MRSQIAVLALVVLCGALAVESSPAAINTAIQSDTIEILKKYMIQTNLERLDARNSQTCFEYYVPVLNAISENFDVHYQACIYTATAEKEVLHEHVAKIRDNVTENLNNICGNIDACKDKPNHLDFFDCVGEEKSDVRSLYSASEDSSETATYARVQLRNIKIKEIICTNATEDDFVKDTARTYVELDDCLRNGFKEPGAPTNKPATDEPATDAPQTEAPFDNPTDEADPVEELVSSSLENVSPKQQLVPLQFNLTSQGG